MDKPPTTALTAIRTITARPVKGEIITNKLDELAKYSPRMPGKPFIVLFSLVVIFPASPTLARDTDYTHCPGAHTYRTTNTDRTAASGTSLRWNIENNSSRLLDVKTLSSSWTHLGKDVTPNELDKLARYETHPDRKFQHTLSMLLKFQDLRASKLKGLD